jgi:hypothetical protein
MTIPVSDKHYTARIIGRKDKDASRDRCTMRPSQNPHRCQV